MPQPTSDQDLARQLLHIYAIFGMFNEEQGEPLNDESAVTPITTVSTVHINATSTRIVEHHQAGVNQPHEVHHASE